MTIGVVYFQSRSCLERNLAKLHIIQISSTCFRPKPCMSRCMLCNIAKFKYFNKIYVFVSRSLSISFNFTFISIHAGLPYRHVFAATHRDIRLYSSVIFNWNLYNKKWKKRADKRWLKIWQNGLKSSVTLKGHFFQSDETVGKKGTVCFIRAIPHLTYISWPVGILQRKWRKFVYLQRHIFSFTCQWINKLPRKENYEVNQQKSSNHAKQLAVPDDNLKKYCK